jgi:hypothetical protein
MAGSRINADWYDTASRHKAIRTDGRGNAGISEATTKVKSYFDAGINLMYAVGAIVGLVGAVKVYNKWNSGDPGYGQSSWYISSSIASLSFFTLR